MTGIYIQNINMLLLLWMVPIIAGLLVYAYFKRKQALKKIISLKMQKTLISPPQ